MEQCTPVSNFSLLGELLILGPDFPQKMLMTKNLEK